MNKNHFISFQLGVIPDWVFLNVKFGAEASNILAIMDLILSLSPSSAETESVLAPKTDKNNIRSKMGHDLLDHSLVIKLESPDVKHFDPHESIMPWNTSGSRVRRPLSKPLGIREIKQNPTTSMTSNVEMDITTVNDESEVEMERDVDDHSSDVDEPTDDDTDESENEQSIFNDLLEYEYECEF